MAVYEYYTIFIFVSLLFQVVIHMYCQNEQTCELSEIRVVIIGVIYFLN